MVHFNSVMLFDTPRACFSNNRNKSVAIRVQSTCQRPLQHFSAHQRPQNLNIYFSTLRKSKMEDVDESKGNCREIRKVRDMKLQFKIRKSVDKRHRRERYMDGIVGPGPSKQVRERQQQGEREVEREKMAKAERPEHRKVSRKCKVVQVEEWGENFGSIRNLNLRFPKRLYWMDNWEKIHYSELFAFCEPSLWRGVAIPTHERIYQMVFEAVFRMQTARLFKFCGGPTQIVASGFRSYKPATIEVFEWLLQRYIAEGRPLQTMVFDCGRVDWTRLENGIYQKLSGDSLPDGVEKMPPRDDLKLYLYRPRDKRAAAISAAQIGAKSVGAFLEMTIKFNWNWQAAELITPAGAMPIQSFFPETFVIAGKQKFDVKFSGALSPAAERSRIAGFREQDSDSFSNSLAPRDPSASTRGSFREQCDQHRHGVGNASAAASHAETSPASRATRKLSVRNSSQGRAGINMRPRKRQLSVDRVGRAFPPHTPERANRGSTVTLNTNSPLRSPRRIVVKKQCSMARFLRSRPRSFVKSRAQPPSEQAPPDKVGANLEFASATFDRNEFVVAVEARPVFSSETGAELKAKAKAQGTRDDIAISRWIDGLLFQSSKDDPKEKKREE